MHFTSNRTKMTIKTKAFVCGESFHVADDQCTVTVDRHTHVALAHSLIQWLVQPLSRTNRFFEVELLEDCNDNFYMIGTNIECTNTILPTWNMYLSIRYRSVEGGVYTGGDGLRSDNAFGNKGDRITVYLEESFLDKSLMNFFLNGRMVYRQWVHVKQGQLYPAIGVSKGPAKFRVTWPGLDGTPSINLISFYMALSNWVGFRYIEKDDTSQTLTITGHDERARLAYSIQAPRPLDTDNNYFELELLTRLDPSIGPAIGLTPAFTSKFQYPGWKVDTIGYHADDGHFYNEASGATSATERDCFKCGVGDRMGCGIVFEPRSKYNHRTPQLVLVYFTKNGCIIYRKIRRLPEGGFYSTVGLFAIGESVRIVNPPLKPFVPPDYKHLFDKWSPVYRQFRFNEAVRFEDYEDAGSMNNVCLIRQQDMPKIIQCVRPYEAECFFKVTILDIGTQTEVHIGAALRDIKTQGQDLRVTPPTAIYVSRDLDRTLNVREGDTICTCIKRDEPGITSINFLINDKVGFRLEHRHNLTDFYYPTLCFLNGTASLHVLWPEDPGISSAEKSSTLDGGIHASDEATLAKLLHGDLLDGVTNTELAQESHPMTDPVPGPAQYNDEQQPLRGKQEKEGKKKAKSNACCLF